MSIVTSDALDGARAFDGDWTRASIQHLSLPHFSMYLSYRDRLSFIPTQFAFLTKKIMRVVAIRLRTSNCQLVQEIE